MSGDLESIPCDRFLHFLPDFLLPHTNPALKNGHYGLNIITYKYKYNNVPVIALCIY
jgi:hypothetical protein